VRESPTCIKLFKNFKETRTFKPPFAADLLLGGALMCIRAGEVCFFFDWAECRLIRRIDVQPKEIKWSESGDLVVVVCEEPAPSMYILRYNREVVQAAFESGAPIGEEGIDSAFDVVHEITEAVRTCVWVGDCLLYTSSNGRLNYTIGSEIITLQHLDRPMYIVGYIKKDNRVYLIDREFSIVSFSLLLSVLEYQTAVVRRDFEAAATHLPSVPREEYNRIARFLEAQGFKEEALQVATDPEHQFELAVSLNKLQAAYEFTIASPSESKWKQIADLALLSSNIALAEECLVRAADLPGLLLLYSSTGHAEGIERLAELARVKGKLNIAFICYFLRGRTHDCLQLLLTANRQPEAAFLARTYAPSKMSEMVAAWKESLKAVNPKAADAIADPLDYPNLFDGLEHAMKAEEWLQGHQLQQAPASIYPEHMLDNESDLIEHMKLLASQPPPAAEAPPEGEVVAAEPEQVEPREEVAEMAVAEEAAEMAEGVEASTEVEPEPVDPPAEEPAPPEPAAAVAEVGEEHFEEANEADALEAELDASLEADLDAELDAELNG